MRKAQRSRVLTAAIAICTFLSALVVRAQPSATRPVEADNIDATALRSETARLAAELKKAQDLIAYQKHLLGVYSAQISKLSEVQKEQAPPTTPATPEAGWAVMSAARVRSQNNLKMIGGALIMYANAHDQKGPATLEELRRWADIPTTAYQSPLLNCRYQYLGYSNNMKGNEVVAYEDSDDPIRNILFADGSVEGLPAERAAKVIADRHK